LPSSVYDEPAPRAEPAVAPAVVPAALAVDVPAVEPVAVVPDVPVRDDAPDPILALASMNRSLPPAVELVPAVVVPAVPVAVLPPLAPADCRHPVTVTVFCPL
jgi:hypothetical protein